MRRISPMIAALALLAGAALWWWHCGVSSRDAPAPLAPPTPQSAPPPAPPPPTRVEVDRHDPLGRPLSHERDLPVITRSAYTLGFDERARLPAWVSFRLAGAATHGDAAPSEVAVSATRDVDVPRSALPEDFAAGGYDAVTLAPSWLFAARGDDDGARAATLASSVAPMHSGLRLGLWRELERRLDAWAGGGEIWATTGPVHAYGEPTLPAGEAVPAGFFLVVLKRDGQRWSTLAFEAPDVAEPPEPERFLVPLARIERETGLEFAPVLPADERAALAEKAAPALWPVAAPPLGGAGGAR